MAKVSFGALEIKSEPSVKSNTPNITYRDVSVEIEAKLTAEIQTQNELLTKEIKKQKLINLTLAATITVTLILQLL